VEKGKVEMLINPHFIDQNKHYYLAVNQAADTIYLGTIIDLTNVPLIYKFVSIILKIVLCEKKRKVETLINLRFRDQQKPYYFTAHQMADTI